MRFRLLLGALALASGVMLTPAPAAAQVYVGGIQRGGVPSVIIVTGPYYPGVFTTGFFLPQPVFTAPRGPVVLPPVVGGGYGTPAAGTGQDRFYLDRSRNQGTTNGAARRSDRTTGRTENALETARRQITVERSEPGLYRIRWNGPTENIGEIEYRALDARGELLRSRVVGMPPFRGLLRVPAETAAVQVIVTREDGSTQSFRLAAADFRTLAGE